MAAKNLDVMVDEAVAMLPPTGQTIEFDAYKAQLYAANPDNGRDVFSHMLRKNVIGKKLAKNSEGKPVVLLSRLS